ncbi:hypothetical protein [Agromyces laixinhei]|uniref:hypothetical protein n=1 Tax=Agromyces laixinhei TaxID=2585717 RepID=UPI00143D6F9D|nr:hypothetical protein [Agromyces laixinhei]
MDYPANSETIVRDRRPYHLTAPAISMSRGHHIDRIIRGNTNGKAARVPES